MFISPLLNIKPSSIHQTWTRTRAFVVCLFVFVIEITKKLLLLQSDVQKWNKEHP